MENHIYTVPHLTRIVKVVGDHVSIRVRYISLSLPEHRFVSQTNTSCLNIIMSLHKPLAICIISLKDPSPPPLSLSHLFFSEVE